MAWYRAGGGGIPSSLKTGMNNVLNKKFGTSTTYPPTDWPDTVNLMGPLPEKTVSGAIASFADGADDVPIKSLVCNVDANLSGVSSVTITQLGKNLWPSTVGAWETGNINATTGQNSSGSAYTRTSDYIKIIPGAGMTISGLSNAGENTHFRVFKYDSTKTYIGFANGSMTNNMTKYNTDDTYYIRIRYVTESITLITPQIEIGQTDTPIYEAPKAPETKTATLGRTIYGGSVDVVNGTGTDENGNDFTFTPTPINSFLGDNNVWADTGDVSCTYRADIALALGGGS